MSNLLCIENLRKSFGQVEAVRDASLAIMPGEFIAIMGRSGSGKSTLLHLLAGLESPTSGSILFEDRQIGSFTEDEFALWRRDHVGLVFQAFHLIPTLSALENVAFPLYPTSTSASKRRQRAQTRLEQVGLGPRASHRPAHLSGGEQQRVGIARALINHPSLILADEPTGNLDTQTGVEVMALFRQLNQQEHVAIVMVTHDPTVAAAADRVVMMTDGRING
jgi:ABC-type lipoprotein export system ATPase subunit